MPLIIFGPGTGIALFRAFLEKRRATGDQKLPTDLLYREEIESLQTDGLLTLLEFTWSREQAAKICVQQWLLEHAREVFDWLERGGAYVCGDASRIAKDVDAALHEVIQRAGGKTSEEACRIRETTDNHEALPARRVLRDAENSKNRPAVASGPK